MFSSYEPELFPGLIYRMIKPKIVLLIFVSGKIVLTGAKVREEIYQAFEMIYPVLQGKHRPPNSIRSVTNRDRLSQGLNHRRCRSSTITYDCTIISQNSIACTIHFFLNPLRRYDHLLHHHRLHARGQLHPQFTY